MGNKKNKHMTLSREQMKILKVAKKRKKVTCNQFNWWDLADMVKQGALDKVVPRGGRYGGWPYFKISHKGKRYLEKIRKVQQAKRNA